MSKESLWLSTLSLGLGDIPQSYQSAEQQIRAEESLGEFYSLFTEILTEMASPIQARYDACSPAEEKKKREEIERFISAIISEDAKHHLTLIDRVVNPELRVQLLETFARSLLNVSELKRFTRPARSVAKTVLREKSSLGGKTAGAKKRAKADAWKEPTLVFARTQLAATNGRFCQLIETFWKKNDIKGVGTRQLAKVVAGWIDAGEITLSMPSTHRR